MNQSEIEKREEFKAILILLGTDESLFSDIEKFKATVSALELIYKPDSNGKVFRHYYSDIFAVLSYFKLNPQKGNIEILGQNLYYIYQNYTPTDLTNNISDNIKKLYDHTSLDIARMTYSDQGDRDLKSDKTFQEIEKKINKLNKDIEIQHRKITNQQKENITILGIFASIVLAFVGGITFNTSVLQNINAVSCYRLFFVIILIGFILVNVIYMLLNFIWKINEKPKLFFNIKTINSFFIVCLTVVFIIWGFQTNFFRSFFQNVKNTFCHNSTAITEKFTTAQTTQPVEYTTIDSQQEK